jgi:hypothetical protein
MQSRTILGELVTVRSSTGFELDGIVYREDSARTTIIHIHGSFGNFYQSRFVRLMASKYRDAGMNLLSVNLAGHDGLAEGYRGDDEFEYAGGAVVDFNEATGDIAGAVDFANGFSDRLILQGHSLGCDRVLQYLIISKKTYEFILLSPCDSYQLQANWIAPETVEGQIERLKNEPPRDPVFDWLPTREYGVKGDRDWTYVLPITRKAFLSIAQGPPYRLIRITRPETFWLKQRALVYIGGMDALQVWPHRTMFNYLATRIGKVEEVYVPQGDHVLTDCEAEIARRIVQWA